MILFFSFIGGLIVGSFANVCIYRLPIDMSLWSPASRCRQCKTLLTFRDNIPVLSFLFLNGRCRSCGVSIAWQYPAVELIMGCLFLFCAAYFSNPFQLLISQVLCFYALTISLIDYRHRIIPDELSLSLAVIALLISPFNPYLEGGWVGVAESFASFLGGGLLLLFLAYLGEFMFKKEALGGGDVKLVAAFGALLGYPGVVFSLLIGSLTGGIVGMGLILIGEKKMGEAIPFGPFLCLGVLVPCFFPSFRAFLVFP